MMSEDCQRSDERCDETDSEAERAAGEDAEVEDDLHQSSDQPRVKKARTSSNYRKQKYRDEWS